MEQQVTFNTDLIKRYDVAAPRYTSYPTAVQFIEGFDATTYRRFTAASNNELIPKPLSLYVHLPFCRSLCYYCGCTKKVTRHEQQGDRANTESVGVKRRNKALPRCQAAERLVRGMG